MSQRLFSGCFSADDPVVGNLFSQRVSHMQKGIDNIWSVLTDMDNPFSTFIRSSEVQNVLCLI